MNIKLYEIKQMAESFNKLINQDLPIGISWTLMEIAELFMENESKYNKLYKKIEDKYSITDDDDEKIIPKDNTEKFKSELEELNNIEFELEIDKIKIDDIKQHVKLSAIDLIKLKKILCK